jgi:hypothetical protein
MLAAVPALIDEVAEAWFDRVLGRLPAICSQRPAVDLVGRELPISDYGSAGC